MIEAMRAGTRGLLRHAENATARLFGARWNPWHELGALSFWFFWLVVVSGVYLFVFFDTSISGAYASVERLTHAQWYAGGVMRSLHRYASDAMAVTVTLHVLREFSLGRFRGAHWFSWFTGVPLLWLLFAAAIGGYWLVWDRLAQYVAIASTEWLESLPGISDALARTFLSDATLSDRLFSLMVFMHIAIPLFLLIGMFVHVKRLKLARTEPQRPLAVGSALALVLLSLVHPALSQGPADLGSTVAVVNLDWFYLNMYPLLDRWSPGAVWALLGGITALLAALPWLSRTPRAQAPALRAAVVDPANCNGCSWCFQDCPYEAITMIAHESKPGHRQARVDPDLCTACGICEGACPSATPFRHVDELVSGIQLPGYPIEQLRKDTIARLEQLAGEARVMVFGCAHALPVAALETDGVAALGLPCIGLLPPSFVDFVSRRPEVDGVLVTGCGPEDCFYRKGAEWTAQRFAGERMPHLRTTAGQHKVRIRWADGSEAARLRAALAEYREELRARAPTQVPLSAGAAP
jgi:ferredoxin/coenzyme F420-reducing hydrogenase delta subunit